MRSVEVIVEHEDNCSSARCRITEVHTNEAERHRGRRAGRVDFVMTGDLTVDLRAKRNHRAKERVYTIVVDCEDPAGNVSTGAVDVIVPSKK